MPKLLSVNSYHYRRGGSDVVYLEHAALMQELGWENAFFAMHHPKNEPTPWDRHFVSEIEFGHAYTPLAKIAMASKVIYSFEARRKVRQLLKEFPADIAHLHCIYHHLSPSIIPALKDAGVPVVMTAHDLKIACPAYKMLNRTGVCERCRGGNYTNVVKYRCVRDSLAASAIVAVESTVHGLLKTYRRHLDKVVVPSRFFRDKFVEWGWPAGQFEYIPNYVDATRFRPDFEPGNYFLYFGRLAPEKGVATLLEAAARAGVPLKVVGTGPEDEALKRLNAEYGQSAEFLGYRSGDELHELIRGALAVVLPSEWYENAPMSVLESFALGKPVVGARIGGIPEMVIDGQSGWAFESRNATELADVLKKIKQAPKAEVAALGRSARAFVEENFSRARYVRATQALYASLGAKA